MNPRANVSIADVYDPHYGLQLILLLCFLVPAILFLFTQHRTLQRIKPENRSMLPSLVWLQLIPVLGQLWQFFVVARISDSIGREMASRNEHPVFGADALIVEQGIKRPTKGIGLAYCILTVIPFLLSAGLEIALLRSGSTEDRDVFMSGLIGLLMIAGVICWVIYWVLLGAWARRLKNRLRMTS